MARDITITFSDGTSAMYRGAPDDVTPDAVKTRAEKEFGKSVTALDGGRAPPTSAAKPGPRSMAERHAEYGAQTDSTMKRLVGFVEPTIEALGAVAGGAAGTALGPAGTVGGSALGYGLAKGGIRVAKEALGMQPAPTSAGEALAGGAKDVVVGGLMEAGGRGVVGPLMGLGAKYVNNLRNIKFDTYLQALAGKGEDVLNALRGQASAVPGAAPTAGEVAAPAGSVGFSVLQERAKKIPVMADTYAAQASKTAAAREAQTKAAGKTVQGMADAVKAKIDRGLTEVSPRETGAALLDIAKKERDTVKKTVIQPAYDAAFKAAGQTRIDVQNVVEAAEQIMGRKLSEFDPATAPETVRKLLALVPKAPEAEAVTVGKMGFRVAKQPVEQKLPEATLQQLDDIRKAINTDVANAKKSMGGAADQALRNLMKVHSAVDDAVKNSETLTPEAKGLYQAALDTYRTVYAPRFKTGVNANLFKQTAINEPKLNPDDVVKTFFQKGGEREAEQFLSMYGKNPDAVKIARTGIEDIYRRQVVDATGTIGPKAHAQFLKDYAEPLRILDGAGLNITARLKVVADDVERLHAVQKLAEVNGIKLRDPLPAGANALAVEKRLGELTKTLTPQQKAQVEAVRMDLAREGEYERLVKAGMPTGPEVTGRATRAGQEAGLPLPNFLMVPITVFNNVFKRLALHMDGKIAMEIAREMANPTLAAESVQNALRFQNARSLSGAAPQSIGRAATTGLGVEAGIRAEPSRNQNALTPR